MEQLSVLQPNKIVKKKGGEFEWVNQNEVSYQKSMASYTCCISYAADMGLRSVTFTWNTF